MEIPPLSTVALSSRVPQSGRHVQVSTMIYPYFQNCLSVKTRDIGFNSSTALRRAPFSSNLVFCYFPLKWPIHLTSPQALRIPLDTSSLATSPGVRCIVAHYQPRCSGGKQPSCGCCFPFFYSGGSGSSSGQLVRPTRSLFHTARSKSK